MQHMMVYRLAQDRTAQLRREALVYRRSNEPRAADHARSWSSLAYWQARHLQRAY